MLRPDEKFVETCERELPAAGVLRAMFPFVNVEWDEWERLGHPGSPADVVPPAALNIEEPGLQHAGFLESRRQGGPNAREAEASEIGAGTLETIQCPGRTSLSWRW
jgi:hypothetical protein